MILDEGRHDERRQLAEVYDDPQPPERIEVAPVVALPTHQGILLSHVRVGDGVKDRRDVREHLRTTAAQMGQRAFVEHHETTIGVRHSVASRRHSADSVSLHAMAIMDRGASAHERQRDESRASVGVTLATPTSLPTAHAQNNTHVCQATRESVTEYAQQSLSALSPTPISDCAHVELSDRTGSGPWACREPGKVRDVTRSIDVAWLTRTASTPRLLIS